MFKDIGHYNMIGRNSSPGNTWVTGYGEHYFQLFNFLKFTNKPSKLSNKGIIEVTCKLRPEKVLQDWYKKLSNSQKIAIKEHPVIFSFCHEFWDCQFGVIENFCDSINKKYEDVAVAVSNFDTNIVDKTKLHIIDTSAWFFKWCCALWFERDSSKSTLNLSKKDYVSLCGKPTISRLKIINFLAKHKLLDRGHISFGIREGIVVHENDQYPYDGPISNKLAKIMMNKWDIKNNYLTNYLPLVLDNTETQINWSNYADIELCVESFTNDTINIDKFGSIGPFTEKTLRPIYYSLPFLVHSTNESIEFEKKLGYYVFDDLHDNTPENIILALKDLLSSSLNLKKYKQKEIKSNKKLLMYHSSNDTCNVYKQIKEWIN